MQFVVSLNDGRTAEVALGNSKRMVETIVRPALTNPQVRPPGEGDYLIVFKVKDVGGKPFKPEAVPIREVVRMDNNGQGQVALVLLSGMIAYPTVALNDLSKAQALLEHAQKAPGKNRRLFFARVDGELRLLETSEIQRSRMSRPPDTRPSTPSPEAPDAG